MTQQPRPLQTLPITWEFAITQQGFVARYGKSGPDHYRQYLPFGVEDGMAHPPKRIDEKLYNLAKLKAGRAQARPGAE